MMRNAAGCVNTASFRRIGSFIIETVCLNLLPPHKVVNTYFRVVFLAAARCHEQQEKRWKKEI